MKGPLDVVSDAGSYEDDGTIQQQEEENDNYFQDPTSIGKYWYTYCTAIQHLFPLPVPGIDPIPTERFPEYVRDMLYGEENKLKAEFLVRSPYMVFPSICEGMFACTYIMTHNGCLNKQDYMPLLCVLPPTLWECVMIATSLYIYTDSGKATSTTLYCGSPTSQQGTQQIQQHLSL